MEPIFRKSMFGFNKHDVSEFILKQSKKSDEQLSELRQEISKLSDSLEETKTALMNSENSSVENVRSLQFNSAVKSDLFVEYQSIASKFTEFSEMLKTASEKAKNSDEKFLELKEKVAVSEELRSKAQKFDLLSSVINGMVNKSAEGSEEDKAIPELSAEHYEATDLFGELSVLSQKFSELKAGFDSVMDIASKFKAEDENGI